MKPRHREYSIHFNQDLKTRLKRRLIQFLTPRHFPASGEPRPPRSETRDFARWLGRRGEAYARWWLRRHKGMVVIDCNFRNGPHELDIVARDGHVLVFVEVRTLSSDHLQRPSASITPTKRENLRLAAAAWRQRRGYKGPWRMDIIGIVWPVPEKEPARVDHFEKSL